MAKPKPITINPSQKRIKQFWACVDKSPGQGPNGDCWEWKGGLGKDGYGKTTIGCQTLRANRVAYFLATGDNPVELLVCHSCDNPPCCNPAHLSKETNAGNQADMKNKGRAASGLRQGRYTKPERTARGERHGARTRPEKFAILNEERVIQIRALHATGNYSMPSLAVRFGVCRSAIQSVVHRRSWKHVT